MSEPIPVTPVSTAGTTFRIDATSLPEELEHAVADLPAGEALVIPLAGLPAGTQIAISIVIGPPEPPPAPEPAPTGPVRRYATGGR